MKVRAIHIILIIFCSGLIITCGDGSYDKKEAQKKKSKTDTLLDDDSLKALDLTQGITSEEIEQKLLQIHSWKMKYLGGNGDSLEKYSIRFSDKMQKYISANPSTLHYAFQKMVDENVCEIATSDDGLFRIYSWNTELGGTMKFFKNIYQYEFKGVAKSIPGNTEEGDPGRFYSNIYSVILNNKTYYLAISNGIYSTRDAGQSLENFSLEKGILNSSDAIFKYNSSLSDRINVNFDFMSVVDRPERPVEIINVNEKNGTIVVNMTDEEGKVLDKKTVYKSNGEYFEVIKK